MVRQIKRTLLLLKSQWKSLLVFEFWYQMIAGILVVPICIEGLKLAIRVAGYSYITNGNLTEILTNPISDILFIIILLILALYSLIEIACLIVCFDCGYHGTKIGVIDLLKEGVKKARKLVSLRNIGLVLFVLLILPLTNFVMLSSFITELTIPEFIMDFINKNVVLSMLFTGLMIIFFLITLHLLFVFHYTFLKNKTAREGAKDSYDLIKGKRMKSIATIVVFNILLTIILLAVFMFVFFITTVGIKNGNQQGVGFAIFLSVMNLINLVLLFVFDSMSISSNYALISTLFYDYTKEKLGVKYEVKETSKKGKKRFCLAFGSVILLLLIGNTMYMYQAIHSGELNEGVILERTKVTSHRGNSVVAPENTLPAFEEAIKEQADYAELDVQETKDGVVIVSHDSNLKRTTGQNKNVWELTYEEIQQLDAGSFFSQKFAGTKIPTLEEVIQLCKGKIKLNIEIKPNGHDQRLEEATVEVIKKNHFEEECVVTSLTYDCLKKVKQIAPELKTGYILSVGIGQFYDLPDTDFFSIESSFITEEVVRQLHSREKEVHAWTVDSEENLEKMIQLEVDNIITDNPKKAKEIIYRKDSYKNKLFDLVWDL